MGLTPTGARWPVCLSVPTGKVVFHKLRPRQEDIKKIVSKIAWRAARVLAKLDAEAIEPDALDAVRGMSQQGELAIKVESVEEAPGRMLASAGGFSPQAAQSFVIDGGLSRGA